MAPCSRGHTAPSLTLVDTEVGNCLLPPPMSPSWNLRRQGRWQLEQPAYKCKLFTGLVAYVSQFTPFLPLSHNHELGPFLSLGA